MIPTKRVKSPRVIWRELEALGVADVTGAQLAVGERIVGLAGMNLDGRLVHADAAGVHETDLPHARWSGLALRDDGGAALVHSDDAIAEVELPSGKAHTLGARLDGPIKNVVYVHDDIAVIVQTPSAAVLQLMQRDGDALETVAKHVFDRFVFAVAGRAGALVATGGEWHPSRVLIVEKGAVREVGEIKPRVGQVEKSADEVVAFGANGNAYEIDVASVLR